MDLVPTPSQTVGPFLHLGLTDTRSVGCLAGAEAKGERIRLICQVLDGNGAPVPDAMIELWQANAEGKYCHPEDTQEKALDPAFRGFGRMPTAADGTCAFETIKPGRVPHPDGNLQAPHLNVSILGRGLLKLLATRLYFVGDPANFGDPILALVPEARRNTLMARPDPRNLGVWRWMIHLCGEGETVFFDV